MFDNIQSINLAESRFLIGIKIMKLQKNFNLATAFPTFRKREWLKNIFLYPTALLTALSLTFLIQEKTNSEVTIITEIFYNVKVCNEYKNKIYVARAKRRIYTVAGARNYGSPYGVTVQASKVSGWGSVAPNECKSFPILKLDTDAPQGRYERTEDWIYIESSDNKKFPSQDLTSYRNSQGGNSRRPAYCVTNKAFNLSSRNYQKIGTNATCPGYNVNQKSTLPEGSYFVRFEPVSSEKNKIVFR
ncbi:MAG: hypothetical protein SWX82_06975 [Cyanobacteriota bacterium]|nr:hypothetical protein [Cyanobacteriota bacterium]